ncbi:hypothetical protein BCR32DRAFT_51862 [Anaeromyces robustus]|uniref:SAP domain-containing protein n=1 Tax=Anaeromyces robustus TaxID=1754192 RepID=A0A1Y1WY10_9FUNG|nr:hypothetical protein BCR32DRAFT_51862 [Anaeromyces robustus]|eukprot:ORX78086.1 hypothetical protein BCR32DRAFT_51862 [Anaeromyces robustus]
MKEKEKYMKKSVQELKNLLKEKRKKVCGKKEVLVERLIMSNLDEINLKIKNELLCKLNLIKDFEVNNNNNRYLYSKVENIVTKPPIPSISKKLSDTNNTHLIKNKTNEVNTIIKKEIKNEKEKNNKKDEGCVASRVLPIAEVLKSIKGEENRISDQYYRIKRKFEYQNLMKSQQQQHHHHHNSVKKSKYF